MKKIYIMPVSEHIALTQETAVLQTSNFSFDENGGTGKLIDKDAEGDALAKRYNVWNEDWSK